MPQFHYAQLRYLFIFALTWLALFFLTRRVLLASHLADANLGPLGLLDLYGVGLIIPSPMRWGLARSRPPASAMLWCVALSPITRASAMPFSLSCWPGSPRPYPANS